MGIFLRNDFARSEHHCFFRTQLFIAGHILQLIGYNRDFHLFTRRNQRPASPTLVRDKTN